MKKLLMGLFVVAVMAAMTACSLDDLPQEKVETKEKVGYLQLSNFKVVSDTEDKNNDDEIEPGTGNSTTSKHTRAGETTSQDDFLNYYIEIVNKAPREGENAVVWGGKYESNLSTNGVLKPIPLEPGNYEVWAYQDNTKGANLTVAQDAPYYAGYSDVSIVSEQTTDVTVTCRLHNIRVTVELSKDLKDMFKELGASDENRLMTEVSIGASEVKNTHIFESSTSHDAPWMYYKDVAGGYGNTMDIKLTGVFYTGPVEDIYTGAATSASNTDKWKPVRMEKKVVGTADNPVTGGQWRRISVDIEHNDEGNAQFIFTIDNYVYDKTITVSTMTMYENIPILKQEEAIPEDDFNDEMAPQVKVDGATFNMENNAFNYSISADMIDSDASTDSFNAWTSFLKVKVDVPSGSTATVNNVYVEFKESTSTTLLQVLEAAGFEDHIIALHPRADENINQYVNVATDGSSFTLNNKGMDAIYNYEGTHRIRVHTEGSDGRRGFADVIIKVSQAASAGPKVIWKANGVTTQKYELVGNGNESVNVSVTSKTGFIPGVVKDENGEDRTVGMTVTIDSDVLVPAELSVVGLAVDMDLFYPANYAMETKLRALGFLPVHPDTTGEDIAEKAAKNDAYRYWMIDDNGKEIRTDREATPLLGSTSESFDISAFLALLAALENTENVEYKSTSTFTITVFDASGRTSSSMVINAKR